MFNKIILSTLLAVPMMGTAADKGPALGLIKQLATQPVAAVIDGTCEIRGAVWNNAPVAGVQIALVNHATGDKHVAVTDRDGVYRASLAYKGKPAVYAEEVQSAFSIREDEHLIASDSRVVCDHRLKLISSNTKG